MDQVHVKEWTKRTMVQTDQQNDWISKNEIYKGKRVDKERSRTKEKKVSKQVKKEGRKNGLRCV